MNTGINNIRREEAKRVRDGALKLIGVITVGWLASKIGIIALIAIFA